MREKKLGFFFKNSVQVDSLSEVWGSTVWSPDHGLANGANVDYKPVHWII